MSHYPIVLLPTEIDRAKNEYPPIPTFTLIPPQPLTIEPPKKVNTSIVLVQATAVTVPSGVLISQKMTGLGLFLLLAGMGAIVARSWQKFKNYARLKGAFDRQVEAHNEELAEYQEKKRWYEEEAQKSQSPERVAEFQYKLLLEVLKGTRSYDGTDSDAYQGLAESEFEKVLKRYFPNKIQTNLTVQNPKFSKDFPYTPDFAYIDKDLNLYIDIELDEPYVYKTKKPIHFLELNKEKERDKHFNDRGWIVIRFSEEQIVRYPDSCCKVIDRVIAEVTMRSIDLQFASIADLQPQKQWTKEEAAQMAADDYRDRYKI